MIDYYALVCKRRIMVNQSIPEDYKCQQQVEISKNIKTVWFVKQGPTKANVHLERDAFHASEKALIRIDLDNSRCEKDVKQIKVKIWRNVKVSADNDSKEYESKVMLISQLFPGIKQGRSEQKLIEVDLSIFGDVERKVKKAYQKQFFFELLTLYKNYNAYKKKKKEILPEDVGLQMQMLPTTHTSLIQVSYVAEVHFYHSGLTWNCKMNPASVPIQIFPSKNFVIFNNNQGIIPKNWSPKVYANTDIRVDMSQQSEVTKALEQRFADQERERKAWSQRIHVIPVHEIIPQQQQLPMLLQPTSPIVEQRRTKSNLGAYPVFGEQENDLLSYPPRPLMQQNQMIQQNQWQSARHTQPPPASNIDLEDRSMKLPVLSQLFEQPAAIAHPAQQDGGMNYNFNGYYPMVINPVQQPIQRRKVSMDDREEQQTPFYNPQEKQI